MKINSFVLLVATSVIGSGSVWASTPPGLGPVFEMGEVESVEEWAKMQAHVNRYDPKIVRA